MIVILLILVIAGGAWFVHAKMGYSWSKILTGAGVALVGIVGWALRTESNTNKHLHESADQVYNASSEQLANWAMQNDDPTLRDMADRELRKRHGDNWRRYL